MQLSNYNTIRFILDIAYEDHLVSNKESWDIWINKISYIFPKKQLPYALISGLYEKNNKELNNQLDKLVNITSITHIETKNKYELWNEKYDKWIERRDNGNKLAQQKRQELIKSNYEAAKEVSKLANETFIQQMKPFWDTQLQECINKRENEIKDILK